MIRYVKANRKVAEFLNLTAKRSKLPDGNYILYRLDLTAFGSLVNIMSIIAQIGGVGLTSAQCRDEQKGITNTILPAPTDERFIIGGNASDSDQSDGSSDESDSEEEEAGLGENNEEDAADGDDSNNDKEEE